MYPNLKAEMARKGITMKQVAKSLNRRAATLSLKFNGVHPFTLDEALAIQELLGVDMPIEILFEKAA